MSLTNVVDTSKPNAGRIYDYLLGGHRNFESDRAVAEQMLKVLPWVKQLAFLQRRCLQGLARELSFSRGIKVIIDFGSGLPTQDHIHTAVAPGTTVIYSDQDPAVVSYAREILGATPNAYYFQADVRQPEEFLNRRELLRILGDERDVAFVTWGLLAYIPDDAVTHAGEALHAWSGPNACWAINAQVADVNRNDPAIVQMLQIMEKMGSPLYLRTLDRLREMLNPWHPDALDFISLMKWHNVPENQLSEEERKAVGASGGGYGAYLVK